MSDAFKISVGRGSDGLGRPRLWILVQGAQSSTSNLAAGTVQVSVDTCARDTKAELARDLRAIADELDPLPVEPKP